MEQALDHEVRERLGKLQLLAQPSTLLGGEEGPVDELRVPQPDAADAHMVIHQGSRQFSDFDGPFRE
ncbi:hypothetical protein ACQ858_18105 [Variovorax ureilyticus]|uniref:hypothetical protein n=1 Tax=Variovorax ureilyticus TaxID=1836198 RepID=UPI003D666E4A